MNKGRIAVVGAVGAALLALLMAGCGGGDTTDTTITKAEFVKRANQICKQAESEREELVKKASALTEPGQELSEAQQTKALLGIFVSPYEKEIARISNLPAPEGEEEMPEALVEAMREALKDVESDPGELARSVDQFNEVNKLSTQYGLSACVL